MGERYESARIVDGERVSPATLEFLPQVDGGTRVAIPQTHHRDQDLGVPDESRKNLWRTLGSCSRYGKLQTRRKALTIRLKVAYQQERQTAGLGYQTCLHGGGIERTYLVAPC